MALSEEQCFLKAIADEPRDGTSRLVYADWLDERGEKPWLSAQIRKGYEIVSVYLSPSFSEGNSYWVNVFDRETVVRGNGDWLDKALEPFDVLRTRGHNNYVGATLLFRGGFLDGAAMGVNDFFNNVKAFGRHPVRTIKLVDFRPWWADFVTTGVGRQWIVYVHNIQLLHDDNPASTEITYLPPQFRSLLTGRMYQAAYGDRIYPTEKEARGDVAQACAAYARKYHGWSAHGG